MVEQVCSVKDCVKKVHAKMMCEMHYRQVLHGRDLTVGRPDDWGNREKHTLYSYWSCIRRRSIKSEMCDEWFYNFWKFVEDVGKRPSKNHILKRFDNNKLYNKDNFYWHEKIIVKLNDESTKEYKRRYQRAHRALNSEKHRDYNLKKRFGISLEDYNCILEQQNNVCSICEGKETAVDVRTKKSRNLAVDHCHKTGIIRGLLCNNCNGLIGHAKDSVKNLERAINYLKTVRE